MNSSSPVCLARCASPRPKESVLAGNFAECDHHVIRRHASGRGDARVDVFQKCKPRFLRPPLDEGDVENNQIVGVMHSDKRRRMQKAVFRQLEDELVEVFGRHAKRILQGGLDGAR